jgi:hypothetical protein
MSGRQSFIAAVYYLGSLTYWQATVYDMMHHHSAGVHGVQGLYLS